MSTPLFRQLQAIIRLGPRKAYHQFMATGDVKLGNLVGTDNMGNEYYENTTEELWIRSRWVVPADYKTFDATMVPPEWHMWLHKIDDRPPLKQITSGPYPWQLPASPNPTGTPAAFKTYSTVLPKVEAWTPQVKERK